jgi:two-component system phosphate regulon response regulator PhoB
MRILIIEESDSIRRMIEALLSARGDEVVAVASGAIGLDRAAQLVPDVVILDWNLPGPYDGLSVCARLRKAPETRETPIVVVTARTDDESRRRALDAGVSAYYTKPFSPTALLKELDMVKRRSSKMQAAPPSDGAR